MPPPGPGATGGACRPITPRARPSLPGGGGGGGGGGGARRAIRVVGFSTYVIRATGSTIVISISDSREGSSAASPMIVCSRRTRPALSRYNFDVVVRSMRVPSASVCVTVVMPSPENGASRTIALSTSTKRTSVSGGSSLMLIAPTSTTSAGAAVGSGRPVAGLITGAPPGAAASALGLMMKLRPRFSGSRFLASSLRSLMTSLSGRPSQPLSTRMRSSLLRMSWRPLLVLMRLVRA